VPVRLDAAWEDFVLRFGFLGAAAPGIAFAIALAGCSGNSSVTPPAPQQVNLVASSAKVAQSSLRPAASTSSSVVWHIDDPAHTATDGQCGAATYPTATSADFVLVKSGGCMRNQLNPIGNGSPSVYFLNPGSTYTWTFQTVTHMGVDTGQYTQRLVWQIHQYACGMSPNNVLGIENMAGGTTGQRWYFLAGGQTFTMPYTEGATDNWQITERVDNSSSGTEQLYRNGVLIANTTGSNFTCGTKPFWNFGPYMWNWVNQGGGKSSLTRVEILFSNMQLSSS
jgi:hypothetical protein